MWLRVVFQNYVFGIVRDSASAIGRFVFGFNVCWFCLKDFFLPTSKQFFDNCVFDEHLFLLKNVNAFVPFVLMKKISLP